MGFSELCLSLKKVDSPKKKNMGSYNEQRSNYFNEALRLHYQENLTFSQISRIIPVERVTISRWVRRFAIENNISSYSSYEMVKSKLPKEPVEEKMTSEEVKVMKAENLKLRQQLRDAELRADLFNEIINVAEKQFNIPIRKKVGAKR